MLNDFTGAAHLYIACGYTDLRRGIDGLAGIVEREFHLDPFSDSLFLFCGRRRDRIKALYWEGNGFLLAVKLEKSVVREHERKKRSGSVRDVVPKNITVEEVRHELPEEECVCPQCGDIMEPVGTEAVETLELIPARAVIHRDVYVKYACQNCKVNDIEVPIVETPKKPSLIPGGFASPKAVAHIMTQKFLLCVPLYRQEQDWKRHGVFLSRQVMSDWVLAGADILQPLYNKLHEILASLEILHADETVLQFLHEAGRKAKVICGCT